MDAAVSQTGLDFRDLLGGAFGGDGFIQEMRLASGATPVMSLL